MVMLKSKSLLVMLVLLCCPTYSAAGALGRLFFTPEDRVYLERLRWTAPEVLPSLPERQQENVAVPEDKPLVITLGGTVMHGNKGQVVWLNGVAYKKADLPENVRLPHPVAAGRIEVQAPEQAKSYSLRTGQTLDMNSGQVSELHERKVAAPVAGAESAQDPDVKECPTDEDTAEPAPAVPTKPGS